MFSFASEVYNNKIFFGGYPNEEWLNILLENNVKIFVDVTPPMEKIKYNLFDYKMIVQNHKCLYYNYPIFDNNIPNNFNEFKEFIISLVNAILDLNSEQKIYIHCKGGHGRSGMIVACLLCYLLNINPEKSLQITTQAHSERENLKEKWKNIRCPQTFRQRKFVMDLFKPVVITSNLYNEKINKNWINFIHETHLRPFKDKMNTKNLTDVLNHFRKLVVKNKNNTQDLICC
jgi:protein-tyrosine phosphatase